MDRFERALRSASAGLEHEFGDDLVGLLFAGSAAYGTPMPNSDLDLYVLVRPNWRQRRNRIVQGVEVELFLNPVAQIDREIDERLPATLDMFARGRVVHDPHGEVARLVERARQVAAEPPQPPTEAERYFIRYRPSDLLRDVEDLAGSDPAAGEMLVGVALRTVLEAHWQIRGEPPPKLKRLLEAFRAEAPSLVHHTEQVMDATQPLADRLGRLRELGERVLEPVGGLMVEGETPPEHLAGPRRNHPAMTRNDPP